MTQGKAVFFFLVTQWSRAYGIYHCIYTCGTIEDKEVCSYKESTCIFSGKGSMGREHFTSHYRITHPQWVGCLWEAPAEHLSPVFSFFTPCPWKACSMSQLWPFLRAVFLKGKRKSWMRQRGNTWKGTSLPGEPRERPAHSGVTDGETTLTNNVFYLHTFAWEKGCAAAVGSTGWLLNGGELQTSERDWGEWERWRLCSGLCHRD